MMSESRKRLSLCLCFLFLGVLVGISIDAKFRPNHIQFWVNPVQKLSVRLHPGDKIEWLELSGKPMDITFWGGSPCVGASTNPCTIGSIPTTATYLYTCKATDGTSFICLDPSGGPISGTNGMRGPDLSVRLLDLMQNILALISRIFGHSLHPAAPGAMQNRAGVIATDQAKIDTPPSDKARTPATYQPIQAQVYCDSNVTHVVVPGDTPDDPIQASAGQNILWGTSGEGLTITPANSTCSQFSTPATDQAECTVAQSGSYTATLSGCTTIKVVQACTPNTSECIVVQQQSR